MTLRAKLHRAKVILHLRRSFAKEGLSDIKRRHSDFEPLRDRIRTAGTDSLSHFGNGYTHEGGLYLQQNPDEFAALTLFLRERGPHANYLEIGSASGGACFFLHKEVGFHSVISLDDGRHPRAESQAAHFARIENFKQFLGDSHSVAARSFLEKNVAARLDVAFIDGDHNYEGVWQDIQLVQPFCRPGSLMILHDTIACEGVNRSWHQCVRKQILNPLAEFIGAEKPLGIAVGEVI
jgi:predicted O-methyltransferase YrrM